MAIGRLHEEKPREIEKERVMNNLHLVRIIAHKIAVNLPPHIEINDLISAGTIGLLQAAARFNEGVGVQFNTYASIRIKGAILDELRMHDHASRSAREKINMLASTEEELRKEFGRPATKEEIAEALGITIEEFFALEKYKKMQRPLSIDEDMMDDGSGSMHEILIDPFFEDPAETVTGDEIVHAVRKAINALPLRKRMVLSLYYLDGLTLREIGEILEITESRVCGLHDDAIKEVRPLLEKELGV